MAELAWGPSALTRDFPREKKLNLYADDTGKCSLHLVPHLVIVEWHNSDEMSVLQRAMVPHINVTENIRQSKQGCHRSSR